MSYGKALPVEDLDLDDFDDDGEDNDSPSALPPPSRVLPKLAALGVTLLCVATGSWLALGRGLRKSHGGALMAPGPDATVTCSLASSIAPLGFAAPFSTESAWAFSHYVNRRQGGLSFVGAKMMKDIYPARQVALCERLRTNETAATLLREAVALGAVIGPLGVHLGAQFSAGDAELARVAAAVAGGGGGSGGGTFEAVADAMVNVPALRAVREAFFDDINWTQALLQTGNHTAVLEYVRTRASISRISRPELAKRYWSLDVPVAHPPPAALAAALGRGAEAAAARAIYGPLSRDGFVRIDRWPGLDVEAITLAGMRALDAAQAASSSPVLHAHSAELEALLRPVLSDEALVRATRAYLGPPLEESAAANGAQNASGGGGRACALGYVALRLTKRLHNAHRYISSLWHHDRAGRRLKLFIFLNDVDPVEGRPTVVARGSHRSVWYSEVSVIDSRFSHKWIEENYEPVPMSGPRGGGFLFDTNSLHQGKLVGANARSVVIVEIDRPGRCNALTKPVAPAKLPFTTPCPSGGLEPVKGTPLSCADAGTIVDFKRKA
mmetsp:Transcript_5688/g.14550  ORF Transcript_5688/g.14550 Transcript_5688/m.14550 type:complete len:554 (-) Transcript_5688:208-1869(-)